MRTKPQLWCRAALLCIFCFLPILVFSSCSNHKPVSDNILVKNGLIFSIDSDEPYTGKVHAVVNSQILEYDVVNGVKDGDFNVLSQKGIMLISGKIKNNKNEGLWQYFYPDGQLESQGYFKNDISSDKWVWYYPDGKLKSTGYYFNGKKEGKWTSYDEYGRIISESVFRNDAVVAAMEEKIS